VSLVFSEFEFDPVQRELRCHGQRLKVDAKLLELLAYFLANPGRLISKTELLDRVWDGRAVADNVLSVSVAKLRKVLGHEPALREFIENSYGRGYRFLPEVRQHDAPAARSSQGFSIAGDGDAPLVGRSEALQRLDAGLQRARGGRGSLCLLTGEPGIGKTRLAEVFEQRALASGFAIAWGRCQATEGTPPLWPFTQVLRELQSAGVIEATSELAGDIDAGRNRDEATSMLSHASLYEAVRGSHRAIDLVTQSLFAAARKNPLLIVIDDLQWADAASLRLLGYLLGEIARAPMLLLATQRSTDLSSKSGKDRDLLRLYAHPHCERVPLERLSSADVDSYLHGMFGTSDQGLSRAVFERSAGNPFFMVELLRPYAGLAPPRPEQLQTSGAAQELVRERLRSLPDVSLEVLSAAAVIGQDFDLGLLAYVTDRPGHELLEALDGSLANDTIVPSHERPGAFAFDHALFREVLYDDLSTRRRCELHARAGDGLAKRRSAGFEVTNAELARHHLAALPLGDVAVAVDYARKAAAAATVLGAHADAHDLLLRGLASLQFAIEPDPYTRTALLLELAIVERVLAEPAFNEHLKQGVALARSLRLGEMLILAGRFLSPGPGMLVKADANEVLEAALEVLPQDALSQRALVLAHLSWTPPACWSARQVDVLLAQAKQLARQSGDQEAIAAVRDAELYFSGMPAAREKADALALEIDREQHWHPSRVGLWRAVYTPIYRLTSATQRGDRSAATRALEELTAQHLDLRNREVSWHYERLLLIERMNHGQWADVGTELAKLREQARAMRLHAWRAISACDYSTFLLNTGDPRAFAKLIRPDLAPVINDLPNSRSLKLRSLAEHGFLDDVRDGLSSIAPEALRDLPHDRDYLAVLADLSVAAVAVGSVEHCRCLYELLRPYADYYAMGISFHCQGSLSHGLGNLARVLGDGAAAVTYLSHGIEQNRAMGLETCMLHNQLDLAELLLARGPSQDVGRARTLLAATAQRAAELGMPPVQHAAESLSAGDPAGRFAAPR